MFTKTGLGPQSGGGRDAGRSVISADVRITGSVATEGVLEFDGRIEGDLSAQALGIGRSAIVRGNISGEHVTVDGTVEGDIAAVNLVLKPSAVVTGAISYGTVTVESGANVNGKFRQLPAPTATPVAAPAAPGSAAAPAAAR
jgi:cytoskeletal protein CcmA (bactofilin family)